MSHTEELTPPELRKFGLITAAMVILFFELLIPWIWGFPLPLWPLMVAGILATLALIIPKSIGPFYRVWMKFADILGWINTRIILSIIFFAVFLPFGLIMRIFNDPMQRRLDKSINTYRVNSTPPNHKNLEKPF